MKNYFRFVLRTVLPFFSNTTKTSSIRMFFLSFVTLFVLQVTFCNLVAQVVICGNEPTYANTEIVIQKLSDPIVKAEESIGSAKIGTDGSFSIQLPVTKTCIIYACLGIYKGYIYVEPGKKYDISFPQRVDKTQAEKMDPFFEPIEFQFAFSNMLASDLNFKIKAFDNAYKPYLEKFTGSIYVKNRKSLKSLFDSAVTVLSNIVPVEGNAFFSNYIFYKLGYLKHLAFQQRTKSISKEYFQGSPVLAENPAYSELFSQVYNRYFYFYGRSVLGKKVYTDINTDKSYSKLVKTLLLDSVLQNDSLRELVILKNIHDEFYAANFSRSGLLEILDTLIAKTEIAQNKQIGQLVREKITRLMAGYPPPPFKLYNKEGRLVSLSDFIGSYVYLNFCVCSSYSCIKEFDALQRMSLKYKEKLVIITISDDDSLPEMADFVSKAGLIWLFLHTGNQRDILRSFDIRAFPTYFLIGPDGKFIYSPAVSPAEGFEMKLFNAMRARKDI